MNNGRAREWASPLLYLHSQRCESISAKRNPNRLRSGVVILSPSSVQEPGRVYRQPIRHAPARASR